VEKFLLDRFRENDRVKVKLENPDSPNKRTPSYVRGKVGIVTTCYGEVVEPDFDRDHRVSWGPLYTVVFDFSDLYDNEKEKTATKIFMDLHESWLESLV
jgi:hypothetical protein